MKGVILVDTCAPVIGVAVHTNNGLFERTLRKSRGGESLLSRWFAELREESLLTEVEAVFVANGPGAFTGIRVGLATALGFAVAYKAQVVAVSSLLSRRHLLPNGRGLVALDARKSRVYAQVDEGEAMDIAPLQLLNAMSAGFYAAGEGSLVYEELIKDAGGIIVEDADQPCFSGLLSEGFLQLKANKGVPAEQIRPIYLRQPDAVPNVHKKIV